jgi:nitrite reductase/ring-hydroxylating ferredoxin subunit
MSGIVSKLRIFLLICILSLFHISCNKEENDVIPDVLVDFYIDLNDPEFFSLNAIGNYVLVNSSTNNLGYKASGYDNNGIIIYRAQDDEFIALDRTCPHDYVLDGTSVAVDVDGIYAECPLCNSTYALPSYGTPTSGPSKYPLKMYRTSLNGQFVHVTNY